MKAIIKLEEGCLPEVQYEENGVQRKFKTSHEVLMQSIFNSFDDIEEIKPLEETSSKVVFKSPILPPNCVWYQLKSNDDVQMALSFPANQYDVTYFNSKFKKVGFPNVIMFVTVSKSISSKGETILKRKNLMAYTYTGNVIREDTPIFKYPYANIYNDGNMCFYEQDTTVQDYAQLQTIYHTWRSTSMNDHLYNPKRTKLDVSLRELLQTFEGKPFDHTILADSYGRFKDFIIS